MLLAAAVDQLTVLAWMKTEDGAKGRNRPKPIPRPGVEPDHNVTKFGGNTTLTIEDAATRLGMEPIF